MLSKEAYERHGKLKTLGEAHYEEEVYLKFK